MSTAKVAISLPQDLLEAIEAARHTYGETRSQFFRRAVEALLDTRRGQDLDRCYVQAYQQTPETLDEGLYPAALAALAQEPWDFTRAVDSG
jgi:hypothetical protein